MTVETPRAHLAPQAPSRLAARPLGLLRSLPLAAAAACGGAAGQASPSAGGEPTGDSPAAATELADQPSSDRAPADRAPADRAEPSAREPEVRGDETAMLMAHNRLRAKHCARPLSWSADLTATAQEWANSLRDKGCRFEHSNTAYGENLAAGTQLSADNAVALWAREGNQYDYERQGFAMETGHFTQMVWAATRSLGCGAAECNGMRIWVCHYDPPGNVLSLFGDNVQPPSCH